jgi:diguanylate cyclase (GGDEF)-like protein
MNRKSLPLAVQLVLTLVGLVVITTLALSVAAYRSFRTNLEDEARRMVRASAEQTEKTLTRIVEQRQERAQGFLNRVTALCGESPARGQTSWEVGCVGLALTEFRTTERALGAVFESGHRRIARVGELPPTDLPLPGSFARLVQGKQSMNYEFTATRGGSALTVLFPVDDLDVVFRDHRVLGGTGEIFLIDKNGHFLTTPRYLGSSTFEGAAVVEPVAECLQGPTDLIGADYRGVKTLHGLRPVPLFFGGACIDAHLAYDEALAPAETLLSQLINGGVVFVWIGALLSLVASRWIAAPVKRLALAARALEGGNFNAPIPVSGPSEIRALARGFMNMARSVADLAQHDFLTHLPNRRLLHDRLTQSIAMARRRGTRLAVLFLDLDRFKHVNDSLGHQIGDKLLQSVAERLTSCVRGSDTVSRQGGDEFVLLLSEIEHSQDAALSAQKMIDSLVAPHEIANHDLHVTVSIGLSIYPDDGRDAETLVMNADTAMYHAKDRGRNNYQFFKAEMNARAVERQWIEGDLRRALLRQEFVLHYQPKMDLVTGAMTGAEALIRWAHPDRGLIQPTQFVPIAEDCGLIVPIGQWVLGEACGQARAWMDAGLRPTSVSVNISALEFRDKDFLQNVHAVLEMTGLDPRFLELELTESVLMQHAESTASVLQALKDIGVRIAVDDFGTGYSSLSYLRQFPIDALKVDQSFVHELTADPEGTQIVSAVISMGKGLNHRVIAEGVETQRQLAFLQALGCGEGQGFYFSRPIVPAQFAKLIQPDNKAHAQPTPVPM